MRPALCQRQLVVYLLHWPQHPLLLALLTERVLCSVAVTDTFPCPAIPTAYSRVAVVLLVAAVLLFFMLLTELSLCQLRTAGGGRNTASSVSLASASPPLDIKKAPAGFQCSREGPLDIFSRYQHTTPRRINHLTKWTSWFPEQQGSQFCQRPVLPPVCGCPLNPEVVRHVLRRAAAVFIVLAVERIQHWIYVNTLDKKS